jgi:uncharacterized protein YdhG (YjbR/CyaY superfamily)
MTDTKPANVDSYIAAASASAQPLLRQLRKVIRSAAPRAEEKISYGMPYYEFNGRLAYFAAHKKHVGLYALGPTTQYPEELKKYATAKGTLQFPFGQALPTASISRLVKARVMENVTSASPVRRDATSRR